MVVDEEMEELKDGKGWSEVKGEMKMRKREGEGRKKGGD